ncbi:hypothetical protein P3383_11815 [Vibrio parahaemolyticus]|nr:hypothetical protein [Vibrio parahaemolyticus]
MSNVKGLVTYFNFDCFGFYRLRKGKNEFNSGTIDDILISMESWLKGKKLKQTMVTASKDVYCRDFKRNAKTKDAVLVIWKGVGSRSGGVGGAYEDENLAASTKETLTTGTEVSGKKILWGQPSYYWLIPEYNKIAAIKFPSSVSDTTLACQYIKAFVDFRMRSENKKTTTVARELENGTKTLYDRTTFIGVEEGGKKKFSMVFKCIARQYKKDTSSADFNKIAQDASHIVYRDTIDKSVIDGRSKWIKALSKVGSLFSNDENDNYDAGENDHRELELIIEANPTVEELQAMFDDYANNPREEGEWYNIGLKRNGRSGSTTWLDEFILKDEIYLNMNNDKDEYYSAEEVLSVLTMNRGRLVNSLSKPLTQIHTQTMSEDKDELPNTEERTA